MPIEVHELIIKAVVTPEAKSNGESSSLGGKLSPAQEHNLIQKSLDQVKNYLNTKNER